MNTEKSEPAGGASNTRTIARNAFWYGLESAFNLLSAFLTTVVVARVIGRTAANQARLGYYSKVTFFTAVSIALGSVGLPATTRKYMAEYLNRGEPGIARDTYLSTLKIQSYIAVGVGVIAMALLLWLGAAGFFFASAVLVAGMLPRLIGMIPSQANNAAEEMRRNTGPALLGGIVTGAITLVSLLLVYFYAGKYPVISSGNWDLVGLSVAVLVGSALESAMKLESVERWLGKVRRVRVGPELRKRMFTYSKQGMALVALNILVWDRSDIFILGWLNPDQREVLFFSVAFTLAERILLIPGVFNLSLASTMMAQYGRDRQALKDMTVDGARYALLMSLPLLVGIACISRPLVLLVYRQPYAPLIPILSIVALFAIPKALIQPPTLLLQAEERQGFLIVWGCLSGAIDLGLDVLLVGKYGAKGAAIANGTGQTLAALGIWIYVWRTNRLDLKLPDFGRILLSAASMAAVVLAFGRLVPGYLGMFGAVPAGAIVWCVAVRLTGALKPQDVGRFLSLGRQLPAGLDDYWKRLIRWLAPASATA